MNFDYSGNRAVIRTGRFLNGEAHLAGFESALERLLTKKLMVVMPQKGKIEGLSTHLYNNN